MVKKEVVKNIWWMNLLREDIIVVIYVWLNF